MKVREAINLIKNDGWRLVIQKGSGSHRQFKHPRKCHNCREAERRSRKRDRGKYSETSETEEDSVSNYLIVIERAHTNYSAFSPDLPGCVSTGRTKKEVLHRMEQAIQLHIQGLREDGLTVPKPRASAEYLAV